MEIGNRKMRKGFSISKIYPRFKLSFFLVVRHAQRQCDTKQIFQLYCRCSIQEDIREFFFLNLFCKNISKRSRLDHTFPNFGYEPQEPLQGRYSVQFSTKRISLFYDMFLGVKATKKTLGASFISSQCNNMNPI